LHNFKDTKDRKWSFQVDVFSVRRVKRDTGVDLLKAVEPGSDVIETLGNDVGILFDVMLSVLQDQLKARDVTEEDFGRALDEAACADATEALMQAILSFFRKPKAKMLKKAFGKVWKATVRQEQVQLERATQAVNSPQFDQVVDQAVAEVIGGAKSSS